MFFWCAEVSEAEWIAIETVEADRKDCSKIGLLTLHWKWGSQEGPDCEVMALEFILWGAAHFWI
jgi:hypothetical protein